MLQLLSFHTVDVSGEKTTALAINCFLSILFERHTFRAKVRVPQR